MQTQPIRFTPAAICYGIAATVEYKRHADDTIYVMVCMDEDHRKDFIDELCEDMNVVEIDGVDLTVMP